MKTVIKYMAFAVASVFLTNCDADFGNINTNPNAVTALKSENLFHDVIGNLGNPMPGEFEYIAPMMQYTATTNGNYNIPGNTYTIDGTAMGIYSGIWNSYCMTYMRSLNLIERKLEEEGGEHASKTAQVNILKALLLSQFSDTFGPIPFEEAGHALDGIIYSKYRNEKEVYLGDVNTKGILAILDESIQQLQTATDDLFPDDIIYDGERNRWIKFASSVLLRSAMKISNVEREIAKTYLNKAISYGLIRDIEDMAKMNHTLATVGKPGYLDNGVAKTLATLKRDRGYCYGESFILALKKFNPHAIDPRLKALAAVYDADGSFYDNYDSYVGMRNGCEMDDVEQVIAEYKFDKDFTPGIGRNGFASFKNETMLNTDAYYIFLGPAEVCFLLAEASWSNLINGNPEAYYREGIRKSMESMMYYGYMIESSDIDAYINSLPALGTNKAIHLRDAQDEIITQKWLSMFTNSMQPWCDWRRTHYPSIVTDHPNLNKLGITDHRLPGRLPFPQDEEVRNKENQAAGVRMLSNQKNDYMNDLWWAQPYFNK